MKSKKINLKNIFAFDFEITTEKHYEVEGNRVRNYGSLAKNLTRDKEIWATNIDDFFVELQNLPKKAGYLFYSHNGSRYDNWNISDYLLNNDFYVKKSSPLFCKEIGDYYVLCDKKSSILCLYVLHNVYDIKGGKKKKYWIEFRDSIRMFPAPLANIGKELGFEKGEINYEINPNWKDMDDWRANFDTVYHEEVLNEDGSVKFPKTTGKLIYEYLERDVDIVVELLLKMNKDTPIEDWGLTLAQTQYKDWQTMYKNKLIDKDIDVKCMIWNFSFMYLPISYKGLDEVDKALHHNNFLNKYFRGGITGPKNNKFHTTIESLVTTLDVNSLYPYVMENMKLPLGQLYSPEKLENVLRERKFLKRENYDFYFYRVEVKEDIRPKGFQFIPKSKITLDLTKKELNRLKVYPDVLPKGSYFLPQPEMEIFLEKYDNSKFTYEWEYVCKSYRGSFNDYIKKYKKEKIDADKKGDLLGRSIAKLKLNALFGKFGQKPIREAYEMNNYGHIMKMEEDSYSGFSKYHPIGCSITSYARVLLIQMYDIFYDVLIYGDTDSVHINLTLDKIIERLRSVGKLHLLDLDMFTWNKDKKIVTSGEFGLWKFEGTFEKGHYKQAKQYFLKNKLVSEKEDEKENMEDLGTDKKAHAGVSSGAQKKLDWEEYKNNTLVVEGAVLISEVVDGGIMLVSKDKEFREHVRYDTYEALVATETMRGK